MSTATLSQEVDALAGTIFRDAEGRTLKRETVDGDRFYFHPVTGMECVSTTTFLGDTNAKPYLVTWSANVAVRYVLDNIETINQMVREGYDSKELQQYIAEESKRIRERRAAAGSYVHSVVEALILWAASPEGRGTDVTLPVLPDDLADVDMDGVTLRDMVAAMLDGFLQFVSDFDLGPEDFLAAEMTVFNQALGIAGTLDAIIILRDLAIDEDGSLFGKPGALYRKPGSILIICADAKTGKNTEHTWQMQLPTYRRMTECVMPDGTILPMPETTHSAVLRLRPEFRDPDGTLKGGYQLRVFTQQEDRDGWNEARHALHTWHGHQNGKKNPGHVVYMPLPDGTPAPTRLIDLDRGYGAAPAALAKAGIRTVRDLARHCVESLLDLKGIGEAMVEAARQILADHGYELPTLGDDYPPRFRTLGAPLLSELLGDGYAAVAKKLTAAGIATIADLANHTEAEVRAKKGIGGKTVDVAALMLADHNIEFDTVLDRMDRKDAADKALAEEVA